MPSSRKHKRILYTAAFAGLFLTELCIALFIRDRFIRPYGGDILVTVLLCCGIRIFLPEKLPYLPVYVFLFAAAVEIGQYFDFVSLLGLGEISFFRILLGSTFSIADIFCYLIGCVLFSAAERFLVRKSSRSAKLM
ncbi:MAG: DUF2809 domain-containing protein [Clostridia bacterium]|nr:DUF2809 domain-containing protein [Clostridia bacterium]